MAARCEAAQAQSAGKSWIESVGVYIASAEPAAPVRNIHIRLPALLEPANGWLSPSAMPKLLASEAGAFYADTSASVVISADDSQANCRTEKATLRRIEVRNNSKPEVPLALDVCGVLRQFVRFRHAVDVLGQPSASSVNVRLIFRRHDAGLPSPPPPILKPSRTSGHVIDETRRQTDDDWFTNQFSLGAPNWTSALAVHNRSSKNARVGVMLKLGVKQGVQVIDSCSVEVPSGDPQLDLATCTALSTSGYTRSMGEIWNWSVDYPVLVVWNGESASMAAPAQPTVPHMPKDVSLKATDRPVDVLPDGRGAFRIQIDLNSDGRATGCTVKDTSGSDLWDAAGCRVALERARFTAARDWFGRPSKGLYEATIDWVAMVIRPTH